MSVSMNERAAGLVDALVADADGLGIEVRTLDSGARLVDCGAQARGGLLAGLGFALQIRLREQAQQRVAKSSRLRGRLHGRAGPGRPGPGNRR